MSCEIMSQKSKSLFHFVNSFQGRFMCVCGGEQEQVN